MRSTLVALVVALALATLGGTVGAKSTAKSSGNGKTANSSYQGTIVSLNKNSITVDIGTNRPERVVVSVDDKTEVTGGGKKGTIADLAKGQIVSVEVSNHHAKKIDVTGVRNSGD